MTIVKKSDFPEERPVIDLTGPDGNAFVLLARAKQYARELELDYDVIAAEMKSGDYEKLVATFEKNFGDYVTLLR